jgi:hypothetical protein
METLGQMSGVDLKDMRREYVGSDRPNAILARIDVLGHGHTLACAVERKGEPAHIRAALSDFLNRALHLTGSATPVIIAPYLPPEAQTVCKDADAGFLDLEGNGRLSIGELFIAERSFPCCVPTRPSALSTRNGKTKVAEA